jgi:NADPH-dependent 2,4-dienoyl-CoA reductase/sulfur reductase-like enzyme
VNEPRDLVVVGGSLAGLRACEAARRLGFKGRISLVGAEDHLPYDRPPLSKEFLEPSDDEVATPWLPGAAALQEELGVDLILGDAATGLDVEARLLTTNSSEVRFDAAIIATGATARTLPGGAELGGVCTFRTLEDAKQVREALDAGARIVVIGAGFIGAEVASAARKRGLAVTILEALDAPLVRAVGPVAGSALGRVHARFGTELRCGVAVDALLGTDRVESVRLADGSEIPAELVVVGIGAYPATDWLADSSLTVDDGVICDETLRAAPGVWAAGDVARWHSPDFNTLLRQEHWTNASEMASHAVRNLLEPESPLPYHHIPYFWSDWYGSRIQFVGVPWGVPELVSGDWDAEAFAALYRNDDRLVGALTFNRRSDIMKYRALIARGATWGEGLDLARERNAR